MIDRRAFSLAVVVCCLFTTVSLSASLESAVETEPGEAIELDYASLPLGVGEASELKASYRSSGSAESGTATGSSPQPRGDGDADRAYDVAGRGGDGETDRSGRGSRKAAGSGVGAGDRSGGAGGAETDGGAGGAGDDRGPFEGLLSALGPWLALLAVTAAILAFARRDRVLAWLKRHLHERRAPADGAAAGVGDSPPSRGPANVVERSWAELVSRAGVDPDPSATPRETAAALVDDGFDRGAVWELAELFEESRYGDAPVTAGRASRSLDCLRRCRRSEVTAE